MVELEAKSFETSFNPSIDHQNQTNLFKLHYFFVIFETLLAIQKDHPISSQKLNENIKLAGVQSLIGTPICQPEETSTCIWIDWFIILMSALWAVWLLGWLAVAWGQVESFGLLTVTHSRKGDYSVLEKYIKLYTQTECYQDFISEINIVWNNQEDPDQTPIFKSKHLWKIPVYFFKTTFNSMDHRYRLPRESTAQLLYSLDDDIIVDCDTFKDTLARYNQGAMQHLGSITTNEVRGYAFDPNTQKAEFLYQGHATALYYSIAEPGAAFIPRHFLELYYLKLEELLFMRKIVLDVKNCDDIFFWAVVQHFYPEIPPVYVRAQKNYKNTDPKVGQSKVKDVYTIRTNCINNISNALGYNSLRLFSKNSSKYLGNWKYPNLPLILSQKTAGMAGIPTVPQEEKSSPGSEQKKESQQLKQKEGAPVDQRPIAQDKKEVHQSSPKVILPEGSTENEKKLEVSSSNPGPTKYNKSSKSSGDSQLAALHSNNQTQIVQKSADAVQREDPEKIAPSIDLAKASRGLSFGTKVGLLSLGVTILMTILYKAYRRHTKLSLLYSQRLQDADQEQQIYSSSIRLPDHY